MMTIKILNHIYKTFWNLFYLEMIFQKNIRHFLKIKIINPESIYKKNLYKIYSEKYKESDLELDNCELNFD